MPGASRAMTDCFAWASGKAEPSDCLTADEELELERAGYAIEHGGKDAKLGSGSYGVVYAVRRCDESDVVNSSTSKFCAKVVDRVFEDNSTAVRMLRELKLMRTLWHPNVMTTETVALPASGLWDRVVMVFERYDSDLQKIIYSTTSLAPTHVSWIFNQILQALKYLQKCQIVHRDIKPANILINRNCDVKICDFGLARHRSPSDSTSNDYAAWTDYAVSRWYRPPELLLCCRHPDRDWGSIDIWSAGCVLGELLLRRPLFSSSSSTQQLQRIIDCIGMPPLSTIDRYDHHAQAALREACGGYGLDSTSSEGSPEERLGLILPPEADGFVHVLAKCVAWNFVERWTAAELLELEIFHEYKEFVDGPTRSLDLQTFMDRTSKEDLQVLDGRCVEYCTTRQLRGLMDTELHRHQEAQGFH